MGRPITQLTFLPISVSEEIENPSTEAGKQWVALREWLGKHQKGILDVYYGRQVEHPEIVQLFIDFDDISSVERLQNLPDFSNYIRTIQSLISPNTSYSSYLVHTEPFPAKAPVHDSPVTEVVTGFSPKPEFFAQGGGRDIMLNGMTTAKGARGIADGKVVGKLKRKDGKGGDMEATIFLIGWDSVEAHKAYQKTKAFRESAPSLVGGMKGGLEVYHVAFKKLELSGRAKL